MKGEVFSLTSVAHYTRTVGRYSHWAKQHAVWKLPFTTSTLWTCLSYANWYHHFCSQYSTGIIHIRLILLIVSFKKDSKQIVWKMLLHIPTAIMLYQYSHINRTPTTNSIDVTNSDVRGLHVLPIKQKSLCVHNIWWQEICMFCQPLLVLKSCGPIYLSRKTVLEHWSTHHKK